MEELASELLAPPRTSLCSCLKAGFSLICCLPFFKPSWYLWWEGKGNKKIICQILLNLTSVFAAHGPAQMPPLLWSTALGVACLDAGFHCELWRSHPSIEPILLNPKHQHSYCFCWSHHHCFPQGFVDVWFCFASRCWHWVFLSTAAARLRRLDPGLVEERGRGNKSHVCLPLLFPPFWEAVWMLQDTW